MTALLQYCGRTFRHGRWCLAAVLALGLFGCANWNAHDEKFHENDLTDTVRKARPEKQEQDGNYLSFSEKGRQIERDLNSQ